MLRLGCIAQPMANLFQDSTVLCCLAGSTQNRAINVPCLCKSFGFICRWLVGKEAMGYRYYFKELYRDHDRDPFLTNRHQVQGIVLCKELLESTLPQRSMEP